MIIAPSKSFLVDFKINNPSDTATHYVRAIVKNSISGIILATLNLADNGSNYFSKEWVTPGDASGTGLQISIQKTVYDDSGYTSESLVYGTTLETYIVRDLAGLRTAFAGGSQGESVNYKKIEKIIRDVIEELPQPKEYDDARVLENIDSTKEKIEELRGNLQQNENKLGAVEAGLKSLLTLIFQRLAKKFEDTSLKIIETISTGNSESMSRHNDLSSNVTDVGKNVDNLGNGAYLKDHATQAVNEVLANFSQELQSIKENLYDDLRSELKESLTRPVSLMVSHESPAMKIKEPSRGEERSKNQRLEFLQKLVA